MPPRRLLFGTAIYFKIFRQITVKSVFSYTSYPFWNDNAVKSATTKRIVAY